MQLLSVRKACFHYHAATLSASYVHACLTMWTLYVLNCTLFTCGCNPWVNSDDKRHLETTTATNVIALWKHLALQDGSYVRVNFTACQLAVQCQKIMGNVSVDLPGVRAVHTHTECNSGNDYQQMMIHLLNQGLYAFFFIWICYADKHVDHKKL